MTTMTTDGVTRSRSTSKDMSGSNWVWVPSMQRDKDSLARKYPGSKRLPTQPSSNNRATTPQKLTTDYLRALRRNVLDAVLQRTQREYIIAVPAVWTEKARELTAQCAVDAGMGSEEKLHLVPKPEASAIYAIWKLDPVNAGGLEVGDTFVLCDAGGGYSLSLVDIDCRY